MILTIFCLDLIIKHNLMNISTKKEGLKRGKKMCDNKISKRTMAKLTLGVRWPY